MSDERENDQMRDPSMTDASSDEIHPIWWKRKSPRLGLKYYRRHRPYVIELDKDVKGIWLVRDVATREQLGAVVQTDPDKDGKGYEPFGPSLLGRKANTLADPVVSTRTISASAEQIWKHAYPTRFRVWLAMNAIVVAVDTLTRLLSLVIAVSVVVIVVWSVPSIWQIKGELLNEVVTWAEELGENDGR